MCGSCLLQSGPAHRLHSHQTNRTHLRDQAAVPSSCSFDRTPCVPCWKLRCNKPSALDMHQSRFAPPVAGAQCLGRNQELGEHEQMTDSGNLLIRIKTNASVFRHQPRVEGGEVGATEAKWRLSSRTRSIVSATPRGVSAASSARKGKSQHDRGLTPFSDTRGDLAYCFAGQCFRFSTWSAMNSRTKVFKAA